MNDNALAALIRTVLLDNFALQQMATVQVLANYQPTSQGRVEGPAVYFFRVGDPLYGWQSRERTWNLANQEFDYKETQIYQSTFQFMAIAPSDPTNLTLPTPNDLLSIAKLILGSRKAVDAFKAQSVGVQRITAQRNPYFLNDRSQFEASPSFDFTVSHKRSIIQQTPAIDSFEANIYRV